MDQQDFLYATGQLAIVKKFWDLGFRPSSRKVAERLDKWLRKRGFKLLRNKYKPAEPEIMCLRK